MLPLFPCIYNLLTPTTAETVQMPDQVFICVWRNVTAISEAIMGGQVTACLRDPAIGE